MMVANTCDLDCWRVLAKWSRASIGRGSNVVISAMPGRWGASPGRRRPVGRVLRGGGMETRRRGP